MNSHATHRLIFIAAMLAPGAADAFVTVGPSGTYATIQEGIDAAVAAGGEEVRVQHKCFTYCPYVESITLDSATSVQIRGGWATDFQSRIAGVKTPIAAAGANAPIVKLVARVSAIDALDGFALVGGGDGSAQSATRGLYAQAGDSAALVISDNWIEDNQLDVSVTSSLAGGAGTVLTTYGDGYIAFTGNTLQANVVLGTDTRAASGGGALLWSRGTSRIDFTLNHLFDNVASNPNGGRCSGGGLELQSNDGSHAELRGNRYEGNALVFCTSGADGDAAHIGAYNTTSGTGPALYEERWIGNRVFNDPGVYQVYVEAHASSYVLGANGLLADGIWGGLYAESDGGTTIALSNFTVSRHPAVGITAVGTGTSIGNMLAWNNGADINPLGGALVLASLAGVDPLFVDAANNDYHVLPGSPAINTGMSVPPGGLRAFDLDGSPRPYGGTAPDAGAYEYHPDALDLIFEDGFD